MGPACAFIVLMFFLISPSICASHASDSITTNQSISGKQKLISVGGNFVLGFFTKDESSAKFYIGIWYKKVSELTPVWVANRATPVSDTTKSLLHISPDGNLALLDQSINSLVWSTNATISSNSSTVAVLLDNGNLVLRDADNSSNIFWQSIENPTHTWLSGGKIALNKITGVSQRLISWKNSEDPAPGLFSLEIKKDGQYQIQWNMSKSYWTTGLWDGRAFTKVPEMTSGYMCDYTYVNNSEENYFSYTLKDNSTISRLIMDVKGQIKMLIWEEVNQKWIQFWSEPEAQCEVTAFCGPFGSCNEQTLQKCSCVKGFNQKSPKDWGLGDYSGGCVRNKRLHCGANNNSASFSEQDKFFQMSSVRLPDLGQALQVSSDHECMLACLNNCSCTAYAYGAGCTVWYGDLLNLQEQYEGLDGGTLFIRLAASELPSHHKIGSVSGLVAGVVAAVVVVVAVVVFILSVTIRRRRRRAFRLVNGALVVFRYSDLQRVTKNFSHKLGSGSFGSVFKGVLLDSTAIAVKKLEGLRQGEKQFRAEVSTLGTIQHVNLVPLRGFCVEGTKRLLVFDYMPNGSLDSHLFHSNDNVLDWSARYRIALGIARGLEYLHEKCRECIIHCDIKPENILLDAEFNPKVADFGLAKLLGREFSHVLTSMRGTIGYLAPEWILGLAITPKADVYSFGMMLLEIISGKRNAKWSENGSHYFPVEAAMKVNENMAHCLLDERLEGNANMEEVNTSSRVACWCIQDMENQRPTMGMVVQMLEGLVEVTVPPISVFLQGLVIDPEDQSHNLEIPASCYSS
ncbi:G-type lectin S-receptor-like serine/threonine-protein kinase At2g19130 [Dioscorea cayenensis subsp. rotundata]|uniref:Receptor-like serine/threonine-protein kinase n=1 Tax=Dioscorea cayennensis subsp. rotundata TaxID=55577 RepID=A0AB40CM34_DIOCR|nr:G-type lectin S-receptor-like serine/threonine-protein kinase At2g19130 [Dioscorea cayenensis subsp. rotundata]